VTFENDGATKAADALEAVARDEDRSLELRVAALAATPSGPGETGRSRLELLLSALEPGLPYRTRTTAADLVAKARLSDESLGVVARALPTVGPFELARLLPVFQQAKTDAAILAALSAAGKSRGLSSLRAGEIRALAKNRSDEVVRRGEGLIARLNANAAEQSRHLDELLAALGDGDVRRGQEVFNSPRAACSVCHAIGYLGGDFGPDLTRVGRIRSARDLLEAVVYPSASFVRSYESVIVATRDGEERSGILRGDSPDAVTLAVGPGFVERLPRSEIVEIRPGEVSLMPGGMEDALTRAELADLIAFLNAARW
ncbi:MAG: hypothetical protein MI757_01730, partial [Pirellulales bacterium]|nr:hypothetical protein [Pirellulales bacterium]